MSTKSTDEICKSIEQIDSRLLNIEKNSVSKNDLSVILAQMKYLSNKLNMMEQINTPSKIKTTYNRNNILSGVDNLLNKLTSIYSHYYDNKLEIYLNKTISETTDEQLKSLVSNWCTIRCGIINNNFDNKPNVKIYTNMGGSCVRQCFDQNRENEFEFYDGLSKIGQL
jgi:hypothetical protein